MSKELVLVTVSGPDHPGITAELMNCIMNSEAKLQDMGQSITHGLLSLSFLVSLESKENSSLIKDLLFTAKKMKMNLDFEIIQKDQEIHNSGDKYILSCVCLSNITADFIYDVSSILAKNNINIQRIDNVTEGDFKSLDIATIAHDKNIDWEKIKSELISISTKHSTDMALLKDDVWRRHKRLIVFDMDSTLIQSEVIVEIAKALGVGDKVHEITESAMNGEIDFDESLRRRVSLLEGLEESKLKGILDSIQLTAGVEEFVKTVKKLGYKVAIISGGFNYFANAFKEQLNLDYAFANELEIKNNKLTGQIQGEIVNAQKKAEILEMLAKKEEINLQQVVAIGDGANDLKMLAKAGLGIAFHAKEIVKKNAKQHMSHGDMTSILYFLGLNKDQT
jgi:phosphoserine phosphatase